MSSGGTAHSSVARLESDAIVSHGFEFRLWYALHDGRCVANALKGMSGAPTSRSDVPRDGTWDGLRGESARVTECQ